MFEFLHESALWVFLQGFCVSLVRPGILIFLALVLLGRLGRGIGLPILFWRPREKSANPRPGKTEAAPLPQFMVGIGIGALVWQVILAGYLFEEFATNYTLDRPPFCEVRSDDTKGIEQFETNVNEMEAWKILGYRIEFPPVNFEFGRRFRYDPLAFSSQWLYAFEVFIGGVAVSLVVTVICALLPVLTWLVVRRRTWTPFQKLAKPTPLPRSFWLPLGIGVGALALSLVSSQWYKTRLAQQTGQVLTTVADWGTASGRLAEVRAKLKTPPPTESEVPKELMQPELLKPDKEKVAAEAKAWFAPYYPLYGAFVLNFLLILAASLVMMLMPQRLSFFTPAVGIVLLLNLLVLSSTLLNYFSPIPSEFVSLVLLGIVVLSGRVYKLKFPNMGDLYGEPLDLNDFDQKRAEFEAKETLAGIGPPPPGGESKQSAIEKSAGNEQDANPTRASITVGTAPSPARTNLLDSERIPFGYTQPKAGRFDAVNKEGKGPKEVLPRLAIVCVSGGGSRAAAWSMKSLLEIERAFAKPQEFDPALDFPAVAFPYQIRLVTGASGGMIAGSYYVASLAAPNGTGVQRNTIDGRPLSSEQLYEGVCGDFLTPITHTLVSRDLPSLFVSMHLGRYDRGAMMEEEWKTTLHGQLDQTFGHMLPGEKAGWRPSLIFSPMMVEDGRQLFISNLDLARVVRNSAKVLGETDEKGNPSLLNPFDEDGRRLLSREGMEFFKAFPTATDFRLSTAARMSASFPYILPAAYLPTNPPRRVVDAGYYDNYGVGIAASWLFNHMEWIAKNTSGVVVIQIRDGTSGPSRRREAASDSFPNAIQAGLHWLTSPPQGLWSFRQSAHTFRNDNLLHLLTDFFEEQALPSDFLSTISFEFPQSNDVALNFTLTEGERETISHAVTLSQFQSQVRSLLEWWHKP